MATKSYETMIGNIEKVLEDLDKRDLSLEEAVSKYKEGMKLIDACSLKLEKVEKELRVVEGDGNE